MASQLSGTSCGNGFHLINNGITNGGGYFDQEKRCREAQAMTAFFWFGFAAFLGSFVLAVVAVYQARKAGMRTSGPSRVNMGGVRPSMSMAQP